MKLESSYIFLENVRLHARHGVMNQERLTGGDFVVSLRVEFSIEKSMCTDAVEDTISYADLYELVRKEMAQPSQLLEHVAYRICRQIIQQFPEVNSVELKLIKKNPPMGADCDGAGVDLKVTNDK